MKSWLGVGAAVAVALLVSACNEKPVEPKSLPTPPTIAEFTADQTRVAPGDQVTLSFKSANATEAVMLDQAGNKVEWMGSAAQGSGVVHPFQTSYYVLTVTGEGGTASAFVQVAVNEDLKDVVLLAVPTTITSGDSAQLIWSAFHATSATIHASTGEDFQLDMAKGSGVIDVKPARSANYLLVANNLNGMKMAQRSADIAVQPVLESFSANPPAALSNVPITFSWKTRGASEVSISEETYGQLRTFKIPADENRVDQGTYEWIVPNNPMGKPLEEGTPLTFTLTVKQANPPVTLTRTLHSFVGEGPKLLSFVAPNAVTAGGNLTLSWRTLNAARVQVFADGGLIYEPVSSDLGSVASGSLSLKAPQKDTTFRIVAYGQKDTQTEASKVVRVVAAPQVTGFTLPASINTAGDPAHATWTTAKATQAVLRVKSGPTLFSTSKAIEVASGAADVLPGVRTTFVLEAYNDAGDVATMEQTVEVTSPATFAVSPSTSSAGETITLNWDVPSDTSGVIGDPTAAPIKTNPGTDWLELDGNSDAQALSFGDTDNATSQIPVPPGFTFPYFGLEASQFFVSTNGFVSFADIGSRAGNQKLDDFKNAIPKLVAPFWDDLVLGSHGSVLYLVDGQSFPRRLVVQWNQVQTRSDPASELTFQVQLSETGELRFGYKTLTGIDAQGQGASIGYRANAALARDLAIAGAPSVVAGDELTYFGSGASPGQYSITAEDPATLVMFARTASGGYVVYPARATVFHPDSVMINEVMLIPEAQATQGHWVELYNTTDQELDLSETLLSSLTTLTQFALPQGTTLAPHSYLVLGESDEPALNGGVHVDMVWDGLTLDPTQGDTLTFSANQVINSIRYSPPELSPGVALQGPDNTALASDGKGVRCMASETFGNHGALGTPGKANTPCFEYALQTIPVSFEDISITGQSLFYAPINRFDEEFVHIPLTTPITTFGTPADVMDVSTNGFVTFIPLTTAGLTNKSLPSNGLPQGTIAPFWDDLEANTLLSTSNVYFERLPATANSPARTIVQWNQLADQAAGDQLTFEVKFFDDGVIEYHYADMISGSTKNYGNGNSATVWLERPDGSAALSVSINKARTWDHTALRFTPRQ